LFDEVDKTLFSSDLFHHDGEVEAFTQSSVVDRCRAALTSYQQGPLANYVPYTQNTRSILSGLAELNPKTVAVMHGSSFGGNCRQSLLDLADVMRDVLDKQSFQFGR
jgi:hypothetical protein